MLVAVGYQSLHSPKSQIAEYFFLNCVEIKQHSETFALLQVLIVRQEQVKLRRKT